MSYETQQAAYKEAQEVLHRLPENWRTRVWENLGWHIVFNCGPIEVYESTYPDPAKGEKTYWACVANDPKTSTPGGPWTGTSTEDKTILGAATKAVAQFQKYRDHHIKVWKEINAAAAIALAGNDRKTP